MTDENNEARRLLSDDFPDGPGPALESMLHEKLLTFAAMAGLCGWADVLDGATVVRIFAFIHAVMLADPGMVGDPTETWPAAWELVREMHQRGLLASLENDWQTACALVGGKSL
jgi:hypothetical protein